MGRSQRMNGTRHGSKFWSDEKENFGFKALQKMGWSPGSGVGKQSQGRTKCITMVLKNDNAGIGGKNTNVTKHRAIVSMYNDILKKANKPKSATKSPSLTVEGYMAKNALYRRFRIATQNEFRLKESEVVLPKKKKKRKKKGFTADDQERIALAQADLKNSGRKGLGFGKSFTPVAILKTPSVSHSSAKKEKKKKKKKRKLAESTASAGVAEKFLDGFLSDLKEHKKRRKLTEDDSNAASAPADAVERSQKKKKKKKKKRKLKDGEATPTKRRKIVETAPAAAQSDESQKKIKKKKKKQKALKTESSSIEEPKRVKKKKKKVKTTPPVAETIQPAKAAKSKKKKKKKKKKNCL